MVKLKVSDNDRRTIRKLITLAELNNFVLEAWMPLVDGIRVESLREFMYAVRSYASYLMEMKRDGELPRMVYENALKELENTHPEVMEDVKPLVSMIEELRKKYASG